MVVKGFKRTLINMIVVVSLLLALCVCVDYASTINYNNNTTMIPDNVTVINSSMDHDNVIIMKSTDKLYTDKSVKDVKKKYPTISMWAKPSVRSGYSYTWHKFTFVDYCPNCKHYHALLKNPKMVPEREYTCRYCDSDFCAVTGKEKYNWSHVYLRRV